MNIKRFIGISFLILAAVLIVQINVALAATVNIATGGISCTPPDSSKICISADDYRESAPYVYTTLTGPAIVEGGTGQVGTGDIVLSAPSGFNFDTTTNSVTATVTPASCTGSPIKLGSLPGASSQTVTPTSTTITITVFAASSGVGCTSTITYSGIKVRPINGAPLASGNITKVAGSPDSVINGVTNGNTNFGTLTEIPGAKNKAVITTQPSSTATAGSDFATKPIVAIQDQFGNTVASDNSSTLAISAVVSPNQICGGEPAPGSLSSTPGTGSAVSSGVISYTAMQYDVASNLKLCFSSAGITSALSDAVNVTAGGSTTSISPSYPDHYAWNDAIGWINFFKTNNTGNSVIIDTAKIKGSAVICKSDANCNTNDYLSFDCATFPDGSDPDLDPDDICSGSAGSWFVSKNGSELAGYAWNDGIGWVSFNCSNTGSCATVDYKVSILQNGNFTGWAWADSVGWISFNCADASTCNSIDYRVKKTAPSPTSGHLTSQTFDVCGGTSCPGAAYNYILWKGDLKGGTNTVKFHFATSDCENGATDPTTAGDGIACNENIGWGGSKASGDGAFLGPNGTSADTDKYENPLGSNIPIPISGIYHKNKRYYRYKVYLFRGGAESPVVEDVIINWSR